MNPDNLIEILKPEHDSKEDRWFVSARDVMGKKVRLKDFLTLGDAKDYYRHICGQIGVQDYH